MDGVELLNRRVTTRGIQLGRVVDVILDADAGIAFGLDVMCGDGERRFVPLAGVRVGADEEGLEVDSPLVMLDRAELGFYTERRPTLRSQQTSTS